MSQPSKFSIIEFLYRSATYWLLIAMGLGGIYVPLRLYFIGEYKDDFVVSTVVETRSFGSGFPPRDIIYAIVQLRDYDSELLSPDLELVPGQNVTLLYSDYLNTAVLLPKSKGILAVIYNYNIGFGGVLVVISLLFPLGLAVALPRRIYSLGHHVYGLLLSLWKVRNHREMQFLDRIVFYTDFFSQTITVGVGFCVITLVVYFLLRALLMVEQTGMLTTGIFLLISGWVIFSPFFEYVINLVLKIRNQEIGRQVIEITRNLIAISAGIFLIVKLFAFLAKEDMRSYVTLFDLLKDLLSYLLN